MNERLFCKLRRPTGGLQLLRSLAAGAKGPRRAVAGVLSTLIVLTVLTATAIAGPGAASAATATPAHPVLAPESGSYVFTLTFDGMQRDYRLHVPPAAASGKPLPLVLNLHGATQNAQLEEITSDMDPNADMKRMERRDVLWAPCHQAHQ
jgi:predicted peptidase